MVHTGNHIITSAAAGLFAVALCTGSAAAGIGGAIKALTGTAAGVFGGVGTVVTGVSAGAAAIAGGALSGGSSVNAGAMTFSGPSSTFTAAGYGDSLTTSEVNASSSSGLRVESSATRTPSALAAYEARQQIAGRLLRVNHRQVVVRASNGATASYSVTPQAAASLEPYVGKNVYLRTVDGRHISSVIGKNDVVRGTVTSIDGDAMTFVSRNGEVRTIALGSRALSTLRLRPGARVVATSNDFDRTMSVGVISLRPSSSLGNVYVGRVDAVSEGTATLGVGASQQQFRVDPTLSSQLQSLRGKTVAANSTDGVHIDSLMTPATLSALTSSTSASRVGYGPVRASVVSASNGRLRVQMPNGDVQSYRTPGNPAAVGVRAGVPVTVTPLGSTHARIAVRGRILSAADANACATVNSTCARSTGGKALSVTPSSLTMRLPSGDVRTYLGNTQSLDANAGTPVTATPLDRTHTRVTASGKVADMLDASACVTINAGCSSVPATVTNAGPSTLSVQFANGNQTTLTGNAANLNAQAGVPVIVQPLTPTSAVVTANGQAATLADAGVCATLNATCPASSVIGSGGGTVGAGAGGRKATESSGGGLAGENGTVSSSFRSEEDLMIPRDTVAYESDPTCGQDGQVVVIVADSAGTAIPSAAVNVSGVSSPRWITSTDGRVRFLRLPEGNYAATISKSGYATAHSREFHVSCTQAAGLDVVLAPAASVSRVQTRAMTHITPALLRRSPATATCVRAMGSTSRRYDCTK